MKESIKLNSVSFSRLEVKAYRIWRIYYWWDISHRTVRIVMLAKLGLIGFQHSYLAPTVEEEGYRSHPQDKDQDDYQDFLAPHYHLGGRGLVAGSNCAGCVVHYMNRYEAPLVVIKVRRPFFRVRHCIELLVIHALERIMRIGCH